MDVDEQLTRAERARGLLENPLYQEAFAVLRAEIQSQWSRSVVGETVQRENLWLMLRLLDKLQGHLKNLVENGKIISQRLADIEKQRKLWRR